MKTSNETKSQFLNMQSSPENFSDEQLEAMMDSIDTMPDVDAEWAKFEAQHLPKQTTSNGMWLRKAAAVVAGFVLVCAVYALSVTLGLAPNIFFDEGGAIAESATHKVNAIESELTQGDDDSESVLFDNVALADILSDFGAYYDLSLHYNSDEVKSVRLYFNWNKSLTLDENIASLNTFEKINIKLDGDTLIIE